MIQRVVISAIAILLTTGGCKNDSPLKNSKTRTEFADASITEFHNLGWIGAMSHPLTESVSFSDPELPESDISPGGLVIREIISDSPAAAAGLKEGDVIVGVEDAWLPINDDPTLDFIALIELRVAAVQAVTELKVLRNGKCESVSLANITKSPDGGSPENNSPVSESAIKGLTYLATLQNDDGSFGDMESSIESRLQTTAIAGISFLASDSEQFNGNIDNCKSYVAAQIDTLSKSAKQKEPVQETTAAKPGVVTMRMPSIELEPLTTAYVLQFLAEADIRLMDQQWMPRLLGLIGALSKSQHESGGWNVSESDDENQFDMGGTHTTNQVLLAVGMIERMGMMGDPTLLTKGCRYLTDQMEARSSGGVDRRIHASLTAGTGVALAAINCQPTDTVLRQAIADGMMQLDQRHGSPSIVLPGILSTAILARQSGNDNWTRFHAGTRYWLSSVQLPDGSFKSIPGSNREPLRLETQPDDLAWQAAHYCLLLSMQSAHLQKLIGNTRSPKMVARNSAGERVGGESSAKDIGVPMDGSMTIQMGTGGAPPPGAKIMKLEDLDEDMREKILEQLKAQGIDPEQIPGLGDKQDK